MFVPSTHLQGWLQLHLPKTMKTNQQPTPKLSLKKNVITRFTSAQQVKPGKSTADSWTSLDTWTSLI